MNDIVWDEEAKKCTGLIHNSQEFATESQVGKVSCEDSHWRYVGGTWFLTQFCTYCVLCPWYLLSRVPSSYRILGICDLDPSFLRLAPFLLYLWEQALLHFQFSKCLFLLDNHPNLSSESVTRYRSKQTRFTPSLPCLQVLLNHKTWQSLRKKSNDHCEGMVQASLCLNINCYHFLSTHANCWEPEYRESQFLEGK